MRFTVGESLLCVLTGKIFFIYSGPDIMFMLLAKDDSSVLLLASFVELKPLRLFHQSIMYKTRSGSLFFYSLLSRPTKKDFNKIWNNLCYRHAPCDTG